jgi:hypothetical protein
VEPHEDQQKLAVAPENDKAQKKRRFQIVKLEDRIAPDKGGTTNKPHPCATQICTTGGY